MSFRCHAAVVSALLLSGCVTQVVEKARVDPNLLAEHEARLLEPYQAGTTVVCRTLVIEANPVLFRNLALPAGKPQREQGEGVEELRWSTRDRVSTRMARDGSRPNAETAKVKQDASVEPTIAKLKVMVGSTAFVVDEQILVRRLFRAPPTLTAHAKGHVMVIRNGKDASNFEEVRFVDGRAESR